ncbi:MAG TPA: glycosyltransferase family 39 protein [Candidatus Obscuribacterales bacterium]
MPGVVLGLILFLIFHSQISAVHRQSADTRTRVRLLSAWFGLALTFTPVLSGLLTVPPQFLFVTGLILVYPCLRVKVDRLAMRLGEVLAALPATVPDPRLPAVIWSAALLFFLEANIGSFFLFHHLPHVQDSICQYFNAKVMAAGQLTAPAPLSPQAFAYQYMIIAAGKWYSQYPPGHMVLLALGHLAGAPWLVNPLFGALSVVLIFFIGREIYGQNVGILAMLLASVCPFLVFMASEFMNHVTTLFFIALFMLCFILMFKNQGLAWGALGGIALGWAFTIRPLTTVALAAPFFSYGLARLLLGGENNRQYCRSFLALIVCSLAILALLAAYNQLTNGSFLRFGYEVYDPNDRLGFGQRTGGIHTVWTGLVQSLRNLNGLNYFLFGWPVPCLVFVAVAAAKGRTNWDLLLILSFLANALVYVLYWYQDWCFGPRYMFESAAALVLLTARGITLLPGLVRDFVGADRSDVTHGYTLLLLIICLAVSFTVYVPASCRYFSDSFWEVDTTLASKLHDSGVKDALVFVKSNYGAFLPQMNPWLDSPIVYARDRGPSKNKEVIERFPGRKVYLQAGNTVIPYRP